MRACLRPLAFCLALLLALPLQAYAVYAASECPMGMHDMGAPMHDSQETCEGCQGGGCALMSFCQNLHTGVPSTQSLRIAFSAAREQIQALAADFPTRPLAPPFRPPRQS